MSSSGWIGVDLDGTLAHYGGWSGGKIGEPIIPMLNRVKAWLEQGVEVRIMTARVARSGMVNEQGQADEEPFVQSQIKEIQDWTEKHLGVRLKVTASKDFAMIELWDDRAVRVKMNTGEIEAYQGEALGKIELLRNAALR